MWQTQQMQERTQRIWTEVTDSIKRIKPNVTKESQKCQKQQKMKAGLMLKEAQVTSKHEILFSKHFREFMYPTK